MQHVRLTEVAHSKDQKEAHGGENRDGAEGIEVAGAEVIGLDDGLRHLLEPATGFQRVVEDRDGGPHHQRALEEIGVDPRHHATCCGVEDHNDQPDDHRDGETPLTENLTGPEDRLDEDSESLELSAEITNGADDHRRCGKPRSQPAAIAAVDDIGDGVDLADPGEETQALCHHPTQETGGETHRDADEQRCETHAVGQPRPADEDKSAEGSGHGCQGRNEEPDALAGDEEILGAPCSSSRPHADDDHKG